MILKKFITVVGLVNNNHIIPPIGNIYGKNIQLPIIGKQYIETEYINKNTAAIRLKGIINKNGTSKIFYENNDIAGVVTGLAWTQFGGEILFVESTLSNGKGNLSITGNIGKVMKESATIALEFIKIRKHM